jgi:hypothetical protein
VKSALGFMECHRMIGIYTPPCVCVDVIHMSTEEINKKEGGVRAIYICFIL